MRWRASAVVATVLAGGCVQQAAFGGPMPVRNQHPAQLLVQHLPATSAAVLRAGELQARADAAYSSLFLNGSGGGNALTLDGEYLRLAAAARIGLGGKLELGVELPVAHTSGGFLDHFVIGWHDFWGFPDQDRSLAPVDHWQVECAYQGRPAFAVDSAPLQLGDVPLWLQAELLPPGERQLGLALQTGLELPTGDQDRGFGNGGVDWSLGAVAEYRLSSLALTGQLQHTFAATPDLAAGAGLRFGDVTAAEVGAELPLLPGFAALVQVQWENSTLRQLGFPRAARDQLLIWAGGRIDLGSGFATELSVGEDLASFVSPDFSLWWSLVYVPGR